MTRNDYYNDYFDKVIMSIITKTIILIVIINYTIVANVTKGIKYNIIQTLVQVHQLSPCNSSEYQTMVNQLSPKRYCSHFPLKNLPLYWMPIHKQIQFYNWGVYCTHLLRHPKFHPTSVHVIHPVLENELYVFLT